MFTVELIEEQERLERDFTNIDNFEEHYIQSSYIKL